MTRLQKGRWAIQLPRYGLSLRKEKDPLYAKPETTRGEWMGILNRSDGR